jgi:N-acyl-D-amino-acid deacylase
MTVAAVSIYSGLSWDAKFEEYQGHPRTAGSRGKALRLGREQGVPLMFTIAQMSDWPAKHLEEFGHRGDEGARPDAAGHGGGHHHLRSGEGH